MRSDYFELFKLGIVGELALDATAKAGIL
jgi:hypothetical protein